MSDAISVANSYGASGLNNPGYPVAETTTAVCLRNVFCAPGGANGIHVVEKASVPMALAKVFGLGSVTISAQATACGPCSAKDIDVALILDRTYSMVDERVAPGQRTIVPADAGPVAHPRGAVRVAAGVLRTDLLRQLRARALSSDYLTASGSLNEQLTLIQKLNCLVADGPTSYQGALAAAAAELNRPERARRAPRR